MPLDNSLGYWERQGRHVFMAAPYNDRVITSATGCFLVDTDGNEYLDMTSGQICALVGHGHPRLLARVQQQIARLAHTGTSFLSPAVFEASEKLARIAPGALTRCILLSTGAEANEFAIRLARAHTGRTGMLALTKGYAGLTLQTSSLTNYGKGARPLVPDTGYILAPDPTRCPEGREPLEWSRELIEQSLEINRGLLDNVAAIIVEPILSAGGLIVLPDGYLRELRALADRLGALLIADEAQTGMGRTGRWFGVQHDDVVPDILVVSKGVGGGYPASAAITTDAIADSVLAKVNQFSSHQSDPLGAAATAAVIDIVSDEGLVDRAARMGQYLRDQLNSVAAQYPQLANVRGRGLMNGFDVHRDPERPVPEAQVGRGVEDFCRARGVHIEVIQRNRFRVLPPLTVEKEHVDRFVGTIAEAMARVASGAPMLEPPRNAQSAAYAQQATRRRGVLDAAKWAWSHSPQAWVARLRGGTRR
jgi:2,2-dialkylglycine decarboxylase (pyruvate)